MFVFCRSFQFCKLNIDYEIIRVKRFHNVTSFGNVYYFGIDTSYSKGVGVGVARNAFTVLSIETCISLPESRIVFRSDLLSTNTVVTVSGRDASVINKAPTCAEKQESLLFTCASVATI